MLHGLLFMVIGLFILAMSLRIARVKSFFWLGIIFIIYGIMKMILSSREKKTLRKVKKRRK